MSRTLHRDATFAAECEALASEVEQAVRRYGHMHDAQAQPFWAYEIDGLGNQLFMDDANVPSLLALPYLGCCDRNDAAYRRTRELVWSPRNPYFFRGKAGAGIGGPHEGLRMIWPMSIMMYAQTSTDVAEIRQCLQWLRDTDAGTGFMHEAFDQDDPGKFTRSWFAWANTLFGELIIDVQRRHPPLLRA